jgi:hypothetical protein
MGTAQVVFAEDRTIVHDRKWRQSHAISGSMRNRKLRHIRPSGAFWLGEALTGSMFCACSAFSSIFFFLVVVTWLTKVIWSLWGSLGCAHVLHNTRSDRRSHGYRMWPKVTWALWGSLGCAHAQLGSCATPVVTEGYVTPLGCSLRHPVL